MNLIALIVAGLLLGGIAWLEASHTLAMRRRWRSKDDTTKERDP